MKLKKNGFLNQSVVIKIVDKIYTKMLGCTYAPNNLAVYCKFLGQEIKTTANSNLIDRWN